MAELSVQEVDLNGLEPSTQSAESGGDSAPNAGTMMLYVENTDTSDHDVQPDDTGTTEYGQDIDPPAITVPAGSTVLIGPFPRDRFGATAQWGYSAATGMQVAAVRLTGVVPT